MSAADERLGRQDPDPDETTHSDAELNAALLRHLPVLMRDLGFSGGYAEDGTWRSFDGRLEVSPDGRWRWAGSGDELAETSQRGRDARERDDERLGRPTFGDPHGGDDERPVLMLPPVDPERLLVRLDVLLRRHGVKLYRRGGGLVRRALVDRRIDDARRQVGTPTLVPVEDDWLLDKLQGVARFRRPDGEILLTPGLAVVRRYVAWAGRRWPALKWDETPRPDEGYAS
jgi:hypothetical protein